MPRVVVPKWDPANKKWYNTTEGSDDDTLTKGKLQTQPRGGVSTKLTGSGTFTPPKMNAGEDSGKYGARVAAARREFDARRR